MIPVSTWWIVTFAIFGVSACCRVQPVVILCSTIKLVTVPEMDVQLQADVSAAYVNGIDGHGLGMCLIPTPLDAVTSIRVFRIVNGALPDSPWVAEVAPVIIAPLTVTCDENPRE